MSLSLPALDHVFSGSPPLDKQMHHPHQQPFNPNKVPLHPSLPTPPLFGTSPTRGNNYLNNNNSNNHRLSYPAVTSVGSRPPPFGHQNHPLQEQQQSNRQSFSSSSPMPFPNGSLPPPSLSASFNPHTPTGATLGGIGSTMHQQQQQRYSQSPSPSPSRSSARSPPLPGGNGSGGHGAPNAISSSSSGRVSPVSFFPHGQTLTRNYSDSASPSYSAQTSNSNSNSGSGSNVNTKNSISSNPPPAAHTTFGAATASATTSATATAPHHQQQQQQQPMQENPFHRSSSGGHGNFSSSNGHWPLAPGPAVLPYSPMPHPDQTPLSIPQTLFLGPQGDYSPQPYFDPVTYEDPYNHFMGSPMPYGQQQQYYLQQPQQHYQYQHYQYPPPLHHHHHHQQQLHHHQQQQQQNSNNNNNHQQRVGGRPLSSQLSSIAGTPLVAPQPSRQRVLQQGHSQTPPFQPLKHNSQPVLSSYTVPQQQQQQQLQRSASQQQQQPQQQSQQQKPQATPRNGQGTPPHAGNAESESTPAGILKIPAGYFPIYNGNEWVMISHAAANAAGIPIPNPQSSPLQNLNGNTGRPEDSGFSVSGSPPGHVALSRQGSEAGRLFAAGTDMMRSTSESRRGSVPPKAGSTRASSPADYKVLAKSPANGSPHRSNTGSEAPNTIQENLDLLELLQKYDYLSAWTRHGKSSKSPSEVGSPVDGTSTPKKQEPFEKAQALKDITEWIDHHQEYLLRENHDLLVPAHIDFGSVNPKADPVIKTVRIENHGHRIVQLKVLKIIPNQFDQLTCHSEQTIYAHPANGTEPMFANFNIELSTGPNLGFFTSWLLILVNESSIIGRKMTWHVTNNTQLDRDMDPYAKTYVPQWVQNLNVIKATTVFTGDQVETIDFQDYLKTQDHPCYKGHNGKFPLEPQPVESLEIILPGQISIDLSADTYASRLQPLLQVEQYLLEEDVASYNLFMTEIKVFDAASSYFQIQVSGLSERCPLLLRGDSVIVRQVTNGVFRGIEYRTFVHGTNMRSNCIYVHLPIGALPSLSHERWNVQFKVNHNRIKEMSRAVGGIQEFIGYHPRDPKDSTGDEEGDRFYSVRSFLFPTIHDAKTRTKLPSLTLEFVDPSLNWEQKSAVQSIVRSDYGPVPFVISGPPGTGKTKTLAETALQILMSDTQSHILITAPSHSACDTIMGRLIPYLKPQYLLRLNAPSRTFAEVPTAIMPYCFGSVYFNVPPLQDLLQFRIVVCTCADAALLISSGASNTSLREYFLHKGLVVDGDPSRSHWTHLLIDEAAQAIEPETDIPLLCLLEETESAPQIVLCGDHYQLGPKTFLPELQLSFLERLMTAEPLYRDHPQSRKYARNKSSSTHTQAKKAKDTAFLEKTIPCFANLVQNYRCHPKMLMMPSAMFYNDTLVASADETKVTSMLGCPILPNPDCPIAFVGVTGLDSSYLEEAVSWYNMDEALQIESIVERLLTRSNDEEDYFNVKMTDIGVIAPFREQVKVLRQQLRAKGYSSVNVGTVEDYQGQEYRIMLISTTRSRAKYLDQDVRQGLGLVHFRKRFNVALTRAMAMMVIVGNPELLVLDEYWAEYLHFCLRNGAYTGCALPDSILNTHTSSQKGAKEALIGRLEMNSFVSQFVGNLDRRRWLGGNTDMDMEGFIEAPTGSESELDDDDDEEDEGEDGEDGEHEGEDDEEEGLHGDDNEDDHRGYDRSRQGYDESLEGLSHALSHELDLSNEHELLAADNNHNNQQRLRSSNHHDQGVLEDDGDREEDNDTRAAMERLALGSLNMDDDTPEMQHMSLPRGPGRQFGHQSSHSTSSSSNSIARTTQQQQQQQEQPNQQQQQPQQPLQQEHDQHYQQSQQSQHGQHGQHVKSPTSWPSNDREFKRMSNSKLVLERSFDPREQDIFEEY
ncbi:hypothetical protein BGZ83_000767 [Gryganskiella cystojenkinii]|nr:hypothetical protein BGZ83_000767 [Gryganskiella cystojenkinii]